MTNDFELSLMGSRLRMINAMRAMQSAFLILHPLVPKDRLAEYTNELQTISDQLTKEFEVLEQQIKGARRG